MLPSLVSRVAPAELKGAAIGVYSSVQFLGAFVGAAAGGFLYSRWGVLGIVVPGAILLAIWLILALGMQAPPPRAKSSTVAPQIVVGEVGEASEPAR